MAIAMMIGSILAGLFGAGMWSVSKSAIHEGVALLSFLIAAVLFPGSAIVNAIDILTKRLDGLLRAGRTAAAHPPTGQAQAGSAEKKVWELG